MVLSGILHSATLNRERDALQEATGGVAKADFSQQSETRLVINQSMMPTVIC